MFPLGTVLFPGQLLPLQIFEPRYLVMIAEVLAGDGEFGIALIERGSEVGGGDVRSDVGCLARVVQAQQLDDGRVGLLVEGVRRLRILEWLEDDPFPRALIAMVDRPEPHAADRDRVISVRMLVDQLASAVTPPVRLDIPSELSPQDFADLISARIGFATFDAQRLLHTDSVGAQLDLLAALLSDAISLIELQRGSN